MLSISENNIDSMLDDVEEANWKERDSTSVTINRNILTDICQSSTIFIFLIIIAIIPSRFLFKKKKKKKTFIIFICRIF